jgi:hypothetical protein
MANSRMKDFFDLSVLAQEFDIQGEILHRAISATFQRRRTEVPAEPVALTGTFTGDAAKQTQWKAFVTRNGLDAALSLEGVVTGLRDFLLPPLAAARQGGNFPARWPVGGPWKEEGSE